MAKKIPNGFKKLKDGQSISAGDWFFSKVTLQWESIDTTPRKYCAKVGWDAGKGVWPQYIYIRAL